MEFLKKMIKSVEEESGKARATADEILNDIETRREEAVLEYAKKFDNWEGEVVVSPELKEQLIAQVPEDMKRDIQFIHDQIREYALRQKECLKEFDAFSTAGIRYGQRVVPIEVAGCYVPGGRFAFVCGAFMSIATAKAAGVPCIIASTGPQQGRATIPPEVCYAMDLAGADVILQLGGAQAIASLAFGLFGQKPVNILAGPGNAYVAEAKSILFGRGVCGIDLFAGPSEIAVIADETADPMSVAIDLVSQAEHNPNTALWLFTTSRAVGEKVIEYMPKLIESMPDPDVCTAAWRDYGVVILCDSREQMVEISDGYAPEHLEIMTRDTQWFLEKLRNYGSLFLGDLSCVPHGDKCSGPNHILPTKKSAKYTGGLNVYKFLKVLTYQEATVEGARKIGEVAGPVGRMEGMEGHSRACDWRLTKYFPNVEWPFHVHRHPKL